MMEWISVKDEMPTGEALLLTTSQMIIIGDWYKSGWRTHLSKWEGKELVSAFSKEDITHWMNLPEPPTIR